MDYVVLKRVRMNCPICNKTHYVEERVGRTRAKYKGDEISYIEKYYCCTNAEEDNEFVTKAMVTENVKNAREAYIASLCGKDE